MNVFQVPALGWVCTSQVSSASQGVDLSSRTYSNTTTRHQSNLSVACGHLDTVYVPDPSCVNTSCRQVQLEVTELMRKASVATAVEYATSLFRIPVYRFKVRCPNGEVVDVADHLPDDKVNVPQESK